MQHFPSPLSGADSDALAGRADAFLTEHGWGLWAVEVMDGGRFAGFTGLAPVRPSLPFAPAIEVGWRLARWSWGRGYATEAATGGAADRVRRPRADRGRVVHRGTNVRSQAVMQRVGMKHDPVDDFDHPDLPVDSPLRRHVLYRIGRTNCLERRRVSPSRPPRPPGRLAERSRSPGRGVPPSARLPILTDPAVGKRSVDALRRLGDQCVLDHLEVDTLLGGDVRDAVTVAQRVP